MHARKWLSRAAHASHHFVRNKKDSVFAADFRDASSVAINGGHCSQGSANDGLENERSHSGWVIGTKESLEIIRARQIAFRISLVKRTVIAKTGCNVAPLLNHGRVRRPPANVAANGHSAECTAVVTLIAGNDAVAGILFSFDKILANELDRGFRRLGAAGSEINAAAILEIAGRDGQNPCSKLFGGLGVELRGMRKRDATGLFRHGSADFRYAVTDADDSSLAGSIEITAAVGRNDPASFAADGDGILLAKISGK